MNTTRIETTIDLGEGLSCRYTIERDGQQPPNMGDKVIARATIFLPHEPNSVRYIDKSLRFESRVVIFGETLVKDWGEGGSPSESCRSTLFPGDTWKEVFEQADTFTRATLQNLVNALEARRNALLEAEK